MLRKDIGFKLAIECRQSALDDDFDHMEMSEEDPNSPFRISDTFQIKSDGCSLSEIKASLRISYEPYKIDFNNHLAFSSKFTF